ncbi:hypothetical protein AOQ84DRAFT_425495 [Glonium stellatum]|uniref:Uncharacterized protein n=1 Tax=Glonium stellatum TaxID=574774 RepID=A0A8E2JLQ5_9PEZI|nr:hypothetical protein AOQ84DRAFT_425495 [Glonium stellatum]
MARLRNSHLGYFILIQALRFGALRRLQSTRSCYVRGHCGTKLLVATRQLTSDDTVGKRSENTGFLLRELVTSGIDSNRQKVAVFLYWREIGYQMGMEGIPETLDTLKTRTNEYQKENIYYAESKQKCVEATVRLSLRSIPDSLQGFADSIAAAFMEKEVRAACGIKEPQAWTPILVKEFFGIRALATRYTLLPRFYDIDVLSPEAPDGRICRTKGFSPGPEYKSHGYLSAELGPVEYEEKWKASVLKEAAEMRHYTEEGGAAAIGCPFAFAG